MRAICFSPLEACRLWSNAVRCGEFTYFLYRFQCRDTWRMKCASQFVKTKYHKASIINYVICVSRLILVCVCVCFSLAVFCLFTTLPSGSNLVLFPDACPVSLPKKNSMYDISHPFDLIVRLSVYPSYPIPISVGPFCSLRSFFSPWLPCFCQFWGVCLTIRWLLMHIKYFMVAGGTYETLMGGGYWIFVPCETVVLEYGGFAGKKGGIAFQEQDIKYVPLDGYLWPG